MNAKIEIGYILHKQSLKDTYTIVWGIINTIDQNGFCKYRAFILILLQNKDYFIGYFYNILNFALQDPAVPTIWHTSGLLFLHQMKLWFNHDSIHQERTALRIAH